MDEVSAEVDEMTAKRGHISDSLPEPLLIILSPPPPFLPDPGELTVSWNKWLKSFEHYLGALSENKLTDSSKCAVLQNFLGQEGQRVYSTLIRGETTYAGAISALTVYFNSQMHLLKFQQRSQRPEETVEQFVSALEQLAKPCNYGDLKDKLILSQLIEKSKYRQLRERLLMEKETLTLPKALIIGKEVESNLNESGMLDIHEVSVDFGDDLDLTVPKVSKRGRPRRGATTGGRRKRHSTRPLIAGNEAASESLDIHEVSVAIEEDLDPPILRGSKRGRPRRGRGATKGIHRSICGTHEVLMDTKDNFNPPAPRVAKRGRPRRGETVAKLKRDSITAPVRGKEIKRASNKSELCDTHDNSVDTKDCLDPPAPRVAKRGRPRKTPCLTITRDGTEEMGGGDKVDPSGQTVSRRTRSQCGESGTKVKCQSARTPSSSSRPEFNRSYNDDVLGDSDDLNSESGDENSQDSNQVDDGATSLSWKIEEEAGDEGSDDDDDDDDYDDDKSNVELISKAKQKEHLCPICDGKGFRTAYKLARHMRTHTKEKPYSCPICFVTISQSYHVIRHLRKQHGAGQYACSQCGKTLSSLLELKVHKKAHTAKGLSCPTCDKQFEEKTELETHIESHFKVNPRGLICTDCGKTFGRMYHLKRHIATHCKSTRGLCFQCPDCPKNFPFLHDLTKHLETHEKENNGICPKCDQTFSSQEELQSHMETHEKFYICTTCGKKFRVEFALKKHELWHNKICQFYCSLCSKQFTQSSHYEKHIMAHERWESRCPHCGRIFVKLATFKCHLRTHTEERPYQCPCCIDTFEIKEDLDQHCLKHKKFKEARPYSCTRCDCAFTTLVELTDHMTSHEGEPPLNCPVCPKSFLNKSKLEKHLSIHTGERPHLCSLCGNGFPNPASLKLHARIHTGEKPFQCCECSKSFPSMSALQRHSRQHMAEQPRYPCPECGRTYCRMTELRKHQRNHTGDKPYSCTCCSKRFTTKDKLIVHMRVHTGERPYSCSHCEQTFTQTGDRNRHIIKFHPLDVTAIQQQ
ncbi:zinc finger protein 16-like [Thalassophryne amazonica]|uniref:zinc finger protein 16-like n=1 Tax=Thalassophryne amazonica TaxID=390379 RepID=UPI0014710880|nr:zinc finger protein 16-like [Thalassophryne amazonica]